MKTKKYSNYVGYINGTNFIIRYNKKFKFYEALTQAINIKTMEPLQKYGNDLNITGQSINECKSKIIDILK